MHERHFRRQALKTLTRTIIVKFGTLIPIWAATCVLAVYGYRVHELEDYGAITVTSARVTDYGLIKRDRFAEYVFNDPISGQPVSGKGTIELSELADLSAGKSTTIDVAFLRDHPGINAPNSYVLDDPFNDRMLPMMTALMLAITSAMVVGRTWNLMKSRRNGVFAD